MMGPYLDKQTAAAEGHCDSTGSTDGIGAASHTLELMEPGRFDVHWKTMDIAIDMGVSKAMGYPTMVTSWTIPL